MHRTQPLAARLLLSLLAGVLILAGWPARTGHAQESPPGYTFQECEHVEEAALRDELNQISQTIFTNGRSEIDIPILVSRKWSELDIDGTIDREIENAVERIYAEESYWDRFLSGWSSDKAKEFTQQIAGDAFGSQAFREQIAALSSAVAAGVADELTVVSARSASSALLCIQSFIGDSYSDTMASLFEAELQEQVAGIDLADVEANVVPLLESHTRSLAGIGVIIGAQIAKRLAQKIAQRIAGKVVGRVLGKAATSAIPLVGWIIGGGLIVWDLIEGGRGALPQIQQALQEDTVKASIRHEVTLTVEEELRKELPEVARTVSNDVYSSWLDFRRKYTQVLNLAETNPQFRTIVDHATAEDVGKLATLVVIGEQALGSEGLETAIEQGTLEQILYLPQEALEILRTTANPELVLAWANLAGADLEKVVATELYKVAAPEGFIDRQDLATVLALDDKEAIAEVMLLNRLQRDVILGLPTTSVVQLSAVFTPEDLRWLASYIAEMDPREGSLLVERLLRDPGLMGRLQHEPVRQAVVASEDVEETLAFLSVDDKELHRSPVETVGKVIDDTERLIGGEVTWLLYWQKYGTWRNLLLVAVALVALWILFRLVWRRSQPVNVTVNLPERYRDRE